LLLDNQQYTKSELTTTLVNAIKAMHPASLNGTIANVAKVRTTANASQSSNNSGNVTKVSKNRCGFTKQE
jgi:hypothetical protein